MADRTRSVLIKFLGDASDLKRATGDADGSTKSLGDRFKELGSKIGEAEGPAGKLKAGLGGLKDIAGSAASGLLSPAGLAAGITAAAGAGLAAVGHFSSATVAVGQFRDATGLTSEEASRLYEALGDLGIQPDTVASALGRMEKTLGTNKDAFKQYGVEVATTKDGLVDANGTFLNAIDALNRIEDPAKRAEAGAKIFGKGWQSMAEVIASGAPALRDALESVQPSKVFSDKDIQSGRDVRAAYDTIGDAIEGLSLTAGKALAPAVASIATGIGNMIAKAEPAFQAFGEAAGQAAENLGPLIEDLGELTGLFGNLGSLDIGGKKINLLTGGILGLKDALGGVADNDYGKVVFGPLGAGMDLVSGKTPELKGGIDAAAVSMAQAATGATELETNTQALSAETSRLTAMAAQYASTADAQAAASERAKVTTEELARAHEENRKAVEADRQAQQDLIDSQRAAADAGFAVTKATNDYHDSVASLQERVKAADGDQGKMKQAYDETTQSADDMAQATVRAYDEQSKANGVTFTATQKIDLWNNQMIGAARTADGPLRQSIINHIAAVNGIPPEKLTEILANVDPNDVAAVEQAINQASRTRTAAVLADADEASIADTNRKLNNIANTRTVTYNTRLDDRGGAAQRGANAIGTRDSGRSWTAGEHGIEEVYDQPHATVYTPTETGLRDAERGGGPGLYIDKLVVSDRAGAEALVSALNLKLRAGKRS